MRKRKPKGTPKTKRRRPLSQRQIDEALKRGEKRADELQEHLRRIGF